MNEPCAHAESGVPGYGRYDVLVCFRCGHVGYRPHTSGEHSLIGQQKIIIQKIPEELGPGAYRQRLLEIDQAIRRYFFHESLTKKIESVRPEFRHDTPV